jgi:TPR repeat protein
MHILSRWLFAALYLVIVSAEAKDVPTKFDPSQYSKSVTECDRLAAHTEDPNKVAPGVSEAKVNLPEAIEACKDDLVRDESNPRLHYQLGRALTYAWRVDEAIPHLQRAVDMGYPQAQFVLGYLLLDGRFKAPTDPCRALDLLRASAVQERMAAQIGLAVWELDGHFSKCPNKPTRAELTGFLKAAKAQKPRFYPDLLIDDLNRQLDARGR